MVGLVGTVPAQAVFMSGRHFVLNRQRFPFFRDRGQGRP